MRNVWLHYSYQVCLQHLRLLVLQVKWLELSWLRGKGESHVEYTITQHDAQSCSVRLSGTINEDAELTLQSIRNDLGSFRQVLFNFARVKTINSLGVRAWVMFVRSIEGGRAIWFDECTPDVIMQINMIPSFQGTARVRSFYTNYVCPKCNSNNTFLIDASKLSAKALPASPACPSCRTAMETEELEDEYFAFLLR